MFLVAKRTHFFNISTKSVKEVVRIKYVIPLDKKISLNILTTSFFA